MVFGAYARERVCFSFGSVIARSELHGWKPMILVEKMEIPKEVSATSTSTCSEQVFCE